MKALYLALFFLVASLAVAWWGKAQNPPVYIQSIVIPPEGGTGQLVINCGGDGVDSFDVYTNRTGINWLFRIWNAAYAGTMRQAPAPANVRVQ